MIHYTQNTSQKRKGTSHITEGALPIDRDQQSSFGKGSKGSIHIYLQTHNSMNISTSLLHLQPLVKSKFKVGRTFWQDGRVGRTRNLSPNRDSSPVGRIHLV